MGRWRLSSVGLVGNQHKLQDHEGQPAGLQAPISPGVRYHLSILVLIAAVNSMVTLVGQHTL